MGEGELCSPEPFAGGAEPFQGSAVIDVPQVARVRILRYLARRGVVHLSPEALEINDELAARAPVLARLAAGAVSSLPPAGPELRRRPPVRLAGTDSPGPTPMGALVVQELGFNLQAASLAGASWRPLVIPPAEPRPAATPKSPATPSAHTKPPPKPPRTGPRCRYWPWAELMRLTLGLPVDTYPHCGGRMKLRVLVRDRESIERFLRHQTLWNEPLGLAETRPPPYFRSVARLKSTSQVELFE